MNLRHLLGTALCAGAAVVALTSSSGCESGGPAGARLKGQVHLTLLHTSDLHSRLLPYNLQLGQIDAGLGLGAAGTVVNVGGAARVSYIIGRERASSTRVLHLDGGDCFQGAPIFNFFGGEAELRVLSAMGTDAMIVANHEFDRGALNLGIQIQNWATFPVLAANYKFEDSSVPGASPLGSVIVPTRTFDLGGLKVGVVGMGNLSSLTSIFDTPNRQGITPLSTIETAQAYVDLLRPLVDVVVFVTHLGLDVDERMIGGTSGIDVVLGGHNHIVLQPPKRVLDCAKFETDAEGKTTHFIEMNGPEGAENGLKCRDHSDCETHWCADKPTEEDQPAGRCKVKRVCEPRAVVLAHSGAFAKYVGRLDLVVSNESTDFPKGAYKPENGFEVVEHDFRLFPINEAVPDDPIVSRVLEPYRVGLDNLANLDLLVGYALDGSKRNSTNGGDSPLGNLIATAMWLRLGIQTDFALTNTTGIRADLVPGPVTVEQMFNIFPFDNSITKMQVSGVEVQELFDFVARRSSGRGCVSQAQIAGARVAVDCLRIGAGQQEPGVASNIYIGATNCERDEQCINKADRGSCNVDRHVCECESDLDCPSYDPDHPGRGYASCDVENGICWQPIDAISSYELATSNYLALGGSGFRVLQRNTTQLDTKVQQRDALVDYIRAGAPCGADESGKLTSCETDGECAGIGEGFVCACPEAVVEGEICSTDASKTCASGKCVLAQCRDDVAAFHREICDRTAASETCEKEIAPCATAGEECKFIACLNRDLGNFSDGRLRMGGQ